MTGDGTHQPGIVERPPAQLVFTAYDLTATDPATARAALTSVLRTWTPAARTLMAGGRLPGNEHDADGLGPAGLTVTIGLGATVLGRAGLDNQLPGQLAPLPAFSTDALDPARGGGDLAVAVCAEDPMVAFSAARQLQRLASPHARARWSQRGFLRTAAAATDPNATPRNLMGQLDGTNNPTPGTATFDTAVWAGADGPAWMAGGTYLVTRRIRMLLDGWDRLSEAGQEHVIGRRKTDGAPLSADPDTATETTPPDLAVTTADGALVIPANAHIRLANPAFHGGVRMFRRGYSYDDGLDATATPDAGLFFQAYQADPRTAFVPVQRTLASSDALTAFIQHTASALFAIPPAPRGGGYLAQPLLET
ncbi:MULTISPECIES: Dyp-type peroxidase [unclassified Frankia]|uniref:Dyp-type peroxidase n=1 Tax=unclassified Frankia TaxID=2632575 RepID=UPI0027DDAB2C|nr:MULTISPECIES: Dyp-type peroxidase [unclassified Frankia]